MLTSSLDTSSINNLSAEFIAIIGFPKKSFQKISVKKLTYNTIFAQNK
ncbi:hypothetical protein COSHB9_13800 [Companilactobacillus alimentarius]|nr:hypothetical protein LAL01_14900 [Companilactobacillus alimentarius]